MTNVYGGFPQWKVPQKVLKPWWLGDHPWLQKPLNPWPLSSSPVSPQALELWQFTHTPQSIRCQFQLWIPRGCGPVNMGKMVGSINGDDGKSWKILRWFGGIMGYPYFRTYIEIDNSWKLDGARWCETKDPRVAEPNQNQPTNVSAHFAHVQKGTGNASECLLSWPEGTHLSMSKVSSQLLSCSFFLMITDIIQIEWLR